MLFWSFVLAFVLSILYYLSPVHNVTQVEDKPLADTMVATFVNAHQAAKRLTYTDTAGTKVVNKQCESTDDSGNPIQTDCLDGSGNPVEIEVEDTSKRIIKFIYKQNMQGLKTAETSGFLSKENTLSALDSTRKYSDGTLAYIDSEEIKKILPAVSEETFNSYNIQSAFACITDAAEGDTTTGPYLTFDCQGGKGGGIAGEDENTGLGDYVITYMQAPHSDEGVARNELWRSGILRRTKGSHECGVLWKTNEKREIIVSAYGYEDGDIKKDEDGELFLYEKGVYVPARIKYDENSHYILDNSRRFTVSVPSLIGLALEARDDGAALTSDMESGYLLFCITPMDDIRASFVDKCKRGYGKYKIVDTAPDGTQTEVWNCTDTGTTTE